MIDQTLDVLPSSDAARIFSLSLFYCLFSSFLIKNDGETRRLPPCAASTSLENGLPTP
jgi:hypothetical protein